MHSFADTTGRVWTITINVATIKAVKGLVGVNIYQLLEDKLRPLGELMNDPIQFADLLYALCKEQADKEKVSDEDFGRALAGDVITQACDAFVEELCFFCPNPRVRESLKKLIAKSKAYRDRLMDRAELELDQIDAQAEADKQAEKLIAALQERKTLNGSFGNSPESSALTPTT